MPVNSNRTVVFYAVCTVPDNRPIFLVVKGMYFLWLTHLPSYKGTSSEIPSTSTGLANESHYLHSNDQSQNQAHQMQDT